MVVANPANIAHGLIHNRGAADWVLPVDVVVAPFTDAEVVFDVALAAAAVLLLALPLLGDALLVESTLAGVQTPDTEDSTSELAMAAGVDPHCCACASHTVLLSRSMTVYADRMNVSPSNINVELGMMPRKHVGGLLATSLMISLYGTLIVVPLNAKLIVPFKLVNLQSIS
jgi:hypothetical protein